MRIAPDDDPAPGEGHLFEISVRLRGRYQTASGEYGDADYWHEEPMVVQVRAWDLPAALRRAAELPLNDWFPEEEPEPRPWIYLRGTVPRLGLLPLNPEMGTDVGDAWIVESVNRIARWDGYGWHMLDEPETKEETDAGTTAGTDGR